jgi:hypothetical protein
MSYECEADNGRAGYCLPGRCRLRRLRQQQHPGSRGIGEPCQMLSDWRTGGGTAEMNAITSDLAKTETAASAQSMTALASAGQALDTLNCAPS